MEHTDLKLFIIVPILILITNSALIIDHMFELELTKLEWFFHTSQLVTLLPALTGYIILEVYQQSKWLQRTYILSVLIGLFFWAVLFQNLFGGLDQKLFGFLWFGGGVLLWGLFLLQLLISTKMTHSQLRFYVRNAHALGLVLLTSQFVLAYLKVPYTWLLFMSLIYPSYLLYFYLQLGQIPLQENIDNERNPEDLLDRRDLE